MRPKTIITYEIKGFQQTIAILPDKGHTYKVIDKADTAELLVNHSFNTYKEARDWTGNYLWMQYNVIVDQIDIDWIETTNPIPKSARRARKVAQYSYSIRFVTQCVPQSLLNSYSIIDYIRWHADLSNFSFNPRVKS